MDSKAYALIRPKISLMERVQISMTDLIGIKGMGKQKRFFCKVCDKESVEKRYLIGHIVREHAVSESPENGKTKDDTNLHHWEAEKWKKNMEYLYSGGRRK